MPEKYFSLSHGAGSIDLPNPIFGYRTALRMPLDVVMLNDGAYATRCEDGAYDKRYCECTLLLAAVHMNALNVFLTTASATAGRGVTCTMTLDSTRAGFLPFGPDKLGASGVATVGIEVIEQGGVGHAPWKYFTVKLRLTAATYSAYTLPTEVDEGPMEIGTVDGLRFPQNFCKPIVRFGDYKTVTENATTQHVDMGVSSDSYATEFEFQGNQSKAAAVLAYLTGTARGSNFSIVFPANTWPFGRQKPVSGSYTVRLINGDIDIVHELPDLWKFNLQVALVSVPS